MGLRIDETINKTFYDTKLNIGNQVKNADTTDKQFIEAGVIYKREVEPNAKSCVYSKEQILGTNYSVENRQFQNNLKILGFYSSSVATDGNLGSQESIRAIKNFQRVYGLPINGGSNDQTRTKLNEVLNFYNNTLNNSNLSTVAQIVNGYSDYNESIVKADIAKTWTFLRVGMGLTSKQASGIMGNIMHESGASPTNAQDSKISGASKLRDTFYVYSTTDDVAYGIIQWKNSSRKQGLLDMANIMGRSVGDSNVQFAYLRKELETSCNSAFRKITGADNVENAARVFCSEVEITAWNDQRLDKANTIYSALG